MRKLLLLSLVIIVFPVFSQERWLAKDVVRLEDADIFLEITDYNSALNIYLLLYKKYGASEDLEFKIGLCYNSLGQKEEAREYFERSQENSNPNASFYLGLYFHQQESFDESIKLFQLFKNKEGKKLFEASEADRMIEISERAKQMKANPVRAMVYNLGDAVNTEYDDYGPLITADESKMAFTSRRIGTTGEKKDPYGEYLEDIYFSANVDDKWTGVLNAGLPLNSKTHDAAVGMSADGQSIIIYRTNKELTAGDLYLSRNTNGTWSEPELMNPAINSEYQEASACLTDDERIIYFSSNRPGGFGGKDIYRVVKISDQIWSLPLNLGPTINTAYDEDAPFIHPNGSTLYFSSKGLKTMGGYDIFKTEFNEDYWSNPENIGYPANTVGDDIFFVLAADGKRGYYSTELANGYGGHDLYAVSFEDAVEGLRIVRGNISNENGEAVSAEINMLNKNGESHGIYKTNAITGNYIIVLPPDEEFKMVVESEGYARIEENLYYKGGTNVREKSRNFTLSPVN